MPMSYTPTITGKVNLKNCFHQMPDLIAKLHQIQCPLGLPPRPHCGSSPRSPDYLARYQWHGRRNGKKGTRKGRKMEGRKRVIRYPHFWSK